jgi:uncharacterized protein
MDLIMTLENKMEKLYKNSPPDHEITHVLRVIENVKIIGKKENADMDVLIPAAILHDISVTNQRQHAVLGAEKARKILKGLDVDKERVEKICSAIRQHSVDNPTKDKRTLEGDCLFDADKLDAIGALGVVRAICENSRNGWTPKKSAKIYIETVNEYTKKYGHIFKTKTGRKLSKEKLNEGIEIAKKIVDESKVL